MNPDDTTMQRDGDSSCHQLAVATPGAAGVAVPALPRGTTVSIIETGVGRYRITRTLPDGRVRYWFRRSRQAALVCQSEVEAGREPPLAEDDPHPAPHPAPQPFRDLSANLVGLAAHAAEGTE